MHLHEIFERISSQGHKVVLVSSLFAGAASKETLNGLEIIRTGGDSTFSLLVALQVRKWIRKFQIDVLIEDVNKLPFYTPLITATPKLILVHHLWRKSIFQEASFPVALLVWLHEQAIGVFYKKCKCTVVSPSTEKELASLGVRDISVVYNGVDLESYIPSLKPKNKNQIFWIGRLQKYKGILDALDAFEVLQKSNADLCLKVAGNGPFRSVLEKEIKNRQLVNIDILGFVSQEEKISLLQESYMVWQTSYKEGWGLTVIEANACGTPVVANNAPGLCDSVQQEQTGLLYDFGDVSSFVKQVMRLYNDEALYDKLQQNCYPWAKTYTWERSAQKTLDILESL